MKAEEYQSALIQIGHVAKAVMEIERLEQVLEAIERCHTVGPMLDPTLYRRMLHDPLAREDLELTEDLVRLMLQIRQRVQKTRSTLLDKMALNEQVPRLR